MPGDASGGLDGIALKPLTVDFHEPGFNAKLAQENQFGPWFTLSGKERQQLGSPMGPRNPQALNRYSYTLNNPIRYVDPSGHYTATEAWEFWRDTQMERIDAQHSKASAIATEMKDRALAIIAAGTPGLLEHLNNWIDTLDLKGWEKDVYRGLAQMMAVAAAGLGEEAVLTIWLAQELTFKLSFDIERRNVERQYQDGLLENVSSHNSTAPPGWHCYEDNCDPISVPDNLV